MENLDTELKKLKRETYNSYLTKFYALFMNNFKFKELDYQQNDYVFKAFWGKGKIACFKIPSMELAVGENANKYDILGFADFASSSWNMFNFPIKAMLINPRAGHLGLLPTGEQIIDKDIVIGFAQRGKNPVRQIVEFYLNKIVGFEMLINTQMIVHKMPFAVKITEENKNRVREIMNELLKDKPLIFLNFDDPNLVDAIISGAPYIIDKLISAKQYYENELLTYLGIDNLGQSEKKEHLVNAEIDSNNMLIKDHADVFVDSIREFAERVEKVFGLKLTLECKSETFQFMNNDTKQTEDKNNEDKM